MNPVIIGDCQLWLGDCMDYMAGLPDKAFDLAIVDPPYGINAPRINGMPSDRKAGSSSFNGKATGRLSNGGGKLKDRILNNADCNWDSEIPSSEYFDELRRVSVNQIIWGGNYFNLPPTRGIVCWDKVQPWPNFSAWEMAWTSFDCVARIFKFDNRTGDKIHPTQKPVELYEWLLANYSERGQTILDTHGGSMSIAIACKNSNNPLTVCESNANYFNNARQRIEQAYAQGDFFVAPPKVKQEQVSLI